MSHETEIVYHDCYREYTESIVAACTRPPRISVSWMWRYGAWRNWFYSHGWPGGSTYHLGPLKIKFKVYDYATVVKAFERYRKLIWSKP